VRHRLTGANANNACRNGEQQRNTNIQFPFPIRYTENDSLSHLSAKSTEDKIVRECEGNPLTRGKYGCFERFVGNFLDQ